MSDKNNGREEIPPPPQQQRRGSTDENSLDDEVPRPGEYSPFSSGRPPLAPPQAGAGPIPPFGLGASPARRPEAFHGRDQSAGEFSFLSALTDDEGERPNHLHDTRTSSFVRHNRAVSWDKHVMDQFNRSADSSPADSHHRPVPPPPPPPVNIVQPVLPDGQMRRPSDPLSPIGSSILEYNSSTSGTRPFSAAVENLVKKVNPVESEAETAIMKAIEQAEDEMNRSQALPLKHFPDEGLDLYESVSSSNQQQQMPGPPSPSSSKSSRKHAAAEDNSSHPSIAPSPSLEKPSHRRGRSTYSMANRNRSDSIEATLFDLTNAMRDVHTAANEAAVPGGHRRGPSSLPFGDTGHFEPPVQNIPENSAEALAQHAQTLFRRNNFAQDDASSATGSHTGDTEPLERPGLNRGKSRLRLFSHDSVKDMKKTDQGAEEHMGVVDEADESAEELSDYPGREASAGDIEHGVPLSQHDNRKNVERRSSIRHSIARTVRRAKRGAKEDWQFFSAFMNPLQSSIITYCRIVFLFIMLPMIAVAAILFYGTSNPLLKGSGASISWLILFLVRQIVTVTMAKGSELLLIDFFSLRSRLTVRVFGPTLTLFLVQAKGFPFILFVWGIFSLVMNAGEHRFARHWLYYQNLIGMFNASNPSGDIPASDTNYRVIASVMIVSLVVAIKRVLIGLYLGKRTLSHYGDQLAKVVQKMVLVSEVAQLSHDYDYEEPLRSKRKSAAGGGRKSQTFSIAPIHGFEASAEKFDEDDTKSLGSSRRFADHMRKTGSVKVIDEERRDARTGSLTQSQRIKMMQLLDDWEEPEAVSRKHKAITINAILQFRQALMFMENAYPFSYSFGFAGNREACIESAQRVYQALVRMTPDAATLPFDTIGTLATAPDGDIDHKKMRALIKIFRPDRDGNLTMLDFVRSCDSVYKQVKVLRASIANSGRIDNASETMFNVVFYAIFLCIMLAANGINPLTLFLSFSSVILAFAWMIGSASSKMFEGIIFILVQRPYDIGDVIAVGGANSDSAFHGAIPWFVLNVDLFTTTIKYAPTGEVATISNGALASSRIINGARSPAPINHIFMKFGVDVPYSKVVVFHKAIEQFVKERPREWVTMHQFRATRVVPEQGFIEYVIVVQHRERWQNLGTVLLSQSDLSSYVLEVAKQLDMHYHAPAMPVELTVKDKKNAVDGSSMSDALAAALDQDERLRVLSSSMFAHRPAAAT